MNDDLRAEYDLDYEQAQPNRFATAIKSGGRMVILDADVAASFQHSEEVNAVLRALLKTMPRPRITLPSVNQVPTST